jgi:hypothetical protein
MCLNTRSYSRGLIEGAVSHLWAALAGARTDEREPVHPGPPAGRRGQTTIDFAVGMAVFMLTLAFVFAFVPGLLQPFTGGIQGETVTVSRVANDLSEAKLGSASTPYVLDPDCTRPFFANESAPSKCNFQGSGTTVNDRVGVKPRADLNITVTGNLTGDDDEDIICWNGATGNASFLERNDAECDPSASEDTVLAIGDSPRDTAKDTVSAIRVVSLAGHDVTIEVEMW